MRRDLDGSINHSDLLKYCGELIAESARQPAPAGPVPDPSSRNRPDLILQHGQPRYPGPMTEAEFLESLLDAEGSFDSLRRLSPEEIRTRQERRERSQRYGGFNWLIP